MAGRWAAKEAVSKVLGLGVRGIGWRDIEVERLPTGQPAVRLHGRAASRAEQLGMGRIAVSITHESDYAVAIAFGIRSTAGATSSRPTSRGGWTNASGGSWPGSSDCLADARRPRAGAPMTERKPVTARLRSLGGLDERHARSRR